ncbi:hypothetical protein FACS1894182_15220 [Bacteroidia bacterium]|nr:hypothetical protein FACS1894182_15220 [Bacteroidia bacterium]
MHWGYLFYFSNNYGYSEIIGYQIYCTRLRIVGSVYGLNWALNMDPIVGQGVAAYSWFRLWFELGAQYGPSTWYGKDDNHWFY